MFFILGHMAPNWFMPDVHAIWAKPKLGVKCCPRQALGSYIPTCLCWDQFWEDSSTWVSFPAWFTSGPILLAPGHSSKVPQKMRSITGSRAYCQIWRTSAPALWIPFQKHLSDKLFGARIYPFSGLRYLKGWSGHLNIENYFVFIMHK